jgi:hypothetical protein
MGVSTSAVTAETFIPVLRAHKNHQNSKQTSDRLLQICRRHINYIQHAHHREHRNEIKRTTPQNKICY